jgi:hypothetical protein
MDWQCVAVDRAGRGSRNDFVSAANRRHYRGSVLEMKKRALIVAVIAFVLLGAALYLWGPSSVPRGQERLITLSNANFREFENAFDADPNVARLVLLLSPT